MKKVIDMTVWKCTNPPKAGVQKQSFPTRFLSNLEKHYNYKNKNVLWMFSGGIKECGTTTDIREETGADIVAPYDNLPIKDETYEIVVADPPYNSLYAKEWKSDLPKVKRILFEASRVTKVGGLVILLHILVAPEYVNSGSRLKRRAIHPVLCGVNNAIRCVSVFEKLSKDDPYIVEK